MGNIDLTGIAYLAVIGLIATLVAIVVGIPALISWVIAHVRII